MHKNYEQIKMLERRIASAKRKWKAQELTLEDFDGIQDYCNKKIDQLLAEMVSVEVHDEVVDEATVEDVYFGGEY